MAEDYKKRIQSAIEGYHKRNMPKPTGRQNDKPESYVEHRIFDHLNGIGWSIDFYESKAVYSEESGSYQTSKVRPGHSDLAGNTSKGEAVYIEVKAPGKRSTLSDNQREFLIDKIETNCFAICADSIDLVMKNYTDWMLSPNKKTYLLNALPLPKKKSDDDDPFKNL